MTVKFFIQIFLFLKKFWMTIFLNFFILFLCFMNPPEVPEGLQINNFDKVVHFLMFFALSGVVFFENSGYFRRSVSCFRIFFGSFLYPTFFSGFIELIQEFLSSTRTGDWIDFLFDGMGIFSAILICIYINFKLKCVSCGK
jgi:VanZ family protein